MDEGLHLLYESLPSFQLEPQSWSHSSLPAFLSSLGLSNLPRRLVLGLWPSSSAGEAGTGSACPYSETFPRRRDPRLEGPSADHSSAALLGLASFDHLFRSSDSLWLSTYLAPRPLEALGVHLGCSIFGVEQGPETPPERFGLGSLPPNGDALPLDNACGVSSVLQGPISFFGDRQESISAQASPLGIRDLDSSFGSGREVVGAWACRRD